MRDLQWQYPEAIEKIVAKIACLEEAIMRVFEYTGGLEDRIKLLGHAGILFERLVEYIEKMEDRIKILESALERIDMESSREYRKYALTRRVAGHEESRRATE